MIARPARDSPKWDFPDKVGKPYNHVKKVTAVTKVTVVTSASIVTYIAWGFLTQSLSYPEAIEKSVIFHEVLLDLLRVERDGRIDEQV